MRMMINKWCWRRWGGSCNQWHCGKQGRRQAETSLRHQDGQRDHKPIESARHTTCTEHTPFKWPNIDVPINQFGEDQIDLELPQFYPLSAQAKYFSLPHSPPYFSLLGNRSRCSMNWYLGNTSILTEGFSLGIFNKILVNQLVTT